MAVSFYVRRPNGNIVGPLSQAQLNQLVESGIIGRQDEVCTPGHPWRAISECPIEPNKPVPDVIRSATSAADETYSTNALPPRNRKVISPVWLLAVLAIGLVVIGIIVTQIVRVDMHIAEQSREQREKNRRIIEASERQLEYREGLKNRPATSPTKPPDYSRLGTRAPPPDWDGRTPWLHTGTPTTSGPGPR